MASSDSFECFVTVGDAKYTICLNKDFDSVVFGDVYEQFRQLSDNNVKFTFDDYKFEVFDFETNAYRRLASIDTPIAFMSRIRVAPKETPIPVATKPTKTLPNLAKRKNFETKFNDEIFNPELVDSERVNQDFFNVDFDNSTPMGPIVAKRKKNFNSGDNYGRRVRPMTDDFYNPDLASNLNYNSNYDDTNNYNYNDNNYNYNEDNYNYDNSLPTISSGPYNRPYTRRSDLTQASASAGPSYSNPFSSQSCSQDMPYYRRRNDFHEQYMAPQDTYSNFDNYYGNNMQPFNSVRLPVRPTFQPNANNGSGFWPSFAQRMNSPKNLNKSKPNQRNGNQKQNTGPSFDKSLDESKTYLVSNGFTIRSKGQTSEFFCEFCAITKSSIALAMNHIKSEEHGRNSGEKFLDPLDKLLMTKPKAKTMEVSRARRQQLRKISETDKRRFIRHGIRLKEGTGPQAYVCTKCCSSMSSLVECYKHMDKFFDLNQCLNYPENYHTLDNDNNYPKLSLRFKRILNALELTVDDKRTPEVEESLIKLRNEATVQKEDIDESKTKYFSCLLCDKRIESIEEGLSHIKSAEHMKNRSSDRFKGLDKAFLTDSEKCGQIEVDLARKQELSTITPTTKEDFLDHGIRLKNGIEPEAYVCITCNKALDCMNDVKTHLDTLKRSEEAKRIGDTNEESLVDSAKKQMELLASKANQDQDFSADVDDSSLINDFHEKANKECIKEVVVNGVTKYYDCICDVYYLHKNQVTRHLSLTFHYRVKNGEFLKPVDKEFCCSTHRINEPEVISARLQVLQRLNDEAKAKFAEEGIRLKDGVGKEAFWCMLCSEPILSPNIESSSMSFINHINYYPKHVELLIAQNK